MISFWRQLRFLLWKGVVVKKRQKIWLAIEVLVPILLFAILALIRMKDFSSYHTTCHYASKGFVSAGLAPFINGWLCFITNKCSISPITGDEKHRLGDGVDRSLVIDGLRAFSDQLAVIGEDPQRFNNSMQSFAQVIHFLASKNLTQTDISENLQLDDVISELDPDLWEHFDSVRKFSDEPLVKFLENLLSFKDTDSLIAAITCGQSITTDAMGASPNGNQEPVHTVSDTLREFIIDYVSQFAPGKADESDETDCYGITIRESNCSFSSHSLLQQMLPMLQGYILVAPAGPLADRLIEKLNDPLRYADYLAALFPQYAEMALALQDAINMSDLPVAATNALILMRRSGLVSNQTLGRLEQVVRTAFAPSSDPSSLGAILKEVAESVGDALKCILIDRIVPVVNETVMESAAMCLQKRQQYFSGVMLADLNETEIEADTVPTVVTYKIRHPSDMVDGTGSAADSGGNMRSRDAPFIDLKYTTFGFSYLQEAVEKALREMLAEDSGHDAVDDVGAYSQQEPFDVTIFLAMFVVLSWMVPSAILVKNIVYEKEQRLKELMRIMGLGDSIHFISWALISLVLNVISVLVISALLKWANILTAADFTLLLVFFSLFALASIAQSLLLSTFFTNANIATAFTAVLVFLCFIPFQLSSQMSDLMGIISLLFPQTAMGFGMVMMAQGDDDGGAHWSTMDQMGIDGFSISFPGVLIALAVDTVLFCIVAWYISAVHPGVHGVSQPWYFPCLPSYWCSTKGADDSGDKDDFIDVESDRRQRDPQDEKMTVAIRGLEMIYGNGMKALDGLNLRLYEGQITGLLGHNGAGKTTTMSMLCGLFSPSGGTASVYGRDLRKELRAVRGTLGFCPQHNVLFEVLTVREQLYFYAALKGVTSENLNKEVTEVIESIGLEEKKDCYSGKLSGGQKRRLSIGIALIGGSKFVILDEPTAGVDVNSRKGIWRLLMKHKKDRTILMSTHHMDEADMLSDRIAILSEGKLTALGSSVFLKSRFGQHTTLTCIKKDNRLNYTQSIEEICKLVEQLPVTIADETEEELTFHLPIAADSQVLEELFRLFDQRLNSWNLAEYGISAPTLQDIFVSLAPQSDLKLTKVAGAGCMGKMLSCFKRGKTSIVASEQQNEPATAETDGLEMTDVCETAPLKQRPSKTRHARALLTARAHYMKRSLLTLFFEMVLPILLLLLCELYAKYANSNDDTSQISTQSPRYLVSSMYGDRNHYLSLWDPSSDGVGAQLAETLLHFPGMGTQCIPGGSTDDPWQPCLEKVEDPGTLTMKSLLRDRENETTYTINQTCGADPYNWDCTTLDYPMAELAYNQGRTTDYLYDLSYRNLSQFRLITHFANKTYYYTGGLALGHVNPAAPSVLSAQQRKEGWRVLREVLGAEAEVIGVDLSSFPTPISPVPDFAGNITIDSFMDRILDAMDTEQSVKLWFNNKRWASLPIYTNVLSNALLRVAHVRNGGSLSRFKQGIVAVNHPMNATLEDSYDQNSDQKVTLFRVVLLVLVLSVIPAGYTVFLVEDRVSHSFHLQIVSGLSRGMYWSMAYLFDMSFYLLSIIIIMSIYLALGVSDFVYTPALVFSFLLLWVLYGIVDIILVYILQRYFNIAALAFVMIALGTFFIGTVTAMTVLMLEQLMQSDPTLYTAHQICYYAFLIIPQYNLGMGISRGAMAYQSVTFGEAYFHQINRPDLFGTVPLPPPLQGELMGIHIVALIVQAIFGLALLIFLEHGSLGFLRRMQRKKTEGLFAKEGQMMEDADVSAEAARVAKIGTNSEQYGLVVKGLAKTFSNKLTVRGVSFAVEKGECFGLLGLNGAGKTTTFGMMTGRLDIGHGEVSILGERVSSRSSSPFRNLGYCPQFDALNMKLTTRENVELFARIRGIEEREMNKTVDSLLRSLHLLPYADILTSALSGGNRRKLSVAVALVSQPPVIMLDEPSAGMDPGSQQFLWSVIGKMRRAGRAVVLTSHSMEECEALCTRIAILDKGKIRCIGSKQHLKSKFGEGYSLTIKFATTRQAEESQAFISQRLPKAKVIPVHCSAAFYRIPADMTTVVQILRVVNEIKQHFSVEDFSLSQTTLDEIFQYLNDTSNNSESGKASKQKLSLEDDFDEASQKDLTIRF